MEDELKIDFNLENIKKSLEKPKKFIIKHKIVLLILIPIILAVFFRAYTYDLPFANNMAEDSLENNIISQIQNQIIAENPNIDENTLNILTQQRYNEYVASNRELIEQQVEQITNQIKSYYQDESGQTYLLAIDPYHYYRQAQNVLDNGHVGDELVDGKPFDNHMLAPNGKETSNDFHSVIGAYAHKISSLFGNDSLMKTMFILPLIFAALSTIPLFFITRKIGGNLGGTIAASILAIHSAFLSRTPAGFSDTDAYSIFFPLVIIWLFLESFTTTNKKNKMISGVLAGLFSGIFAFAWGGWWYVLDFILASMGIYFIYLLIKHKKEVFKKIKTKNLVKTMVYFIGSSALFVTLFTSFGTFLGAFKSPIDIVFLKEAAKSTLWPNVYTTVAELNAISIPGVISNLGGKLFFAIATIGILLILLKKNKKQLDIKYGILMVVWFIGTLYTTTKGIRFIMFMVPVFAAGIGIFSAKAYNFITNWSEKELKIKKKLVSALLIIIIILSFIPLIKSANISSKQQAPSMNDAWYGALTKIKEETPENTIITSWWDFGHWFKAIADRAVTFDGASQNRPPAHWVGKILLTNDENEAIGLLRMLDCGGNDAYNLLLEEIEDPLTTKSTIDEIVLLDENSARTILNQHLEDPEKILEKTHCSAPPAVFITSEDMVAKSGVWAHFGSWDFERSFMYNTIRNNNKENSINIISDRLGYSEEESSLFFNELNGLPDTEANNWIAPYPSYSHEGSCQIRNNTATCSNGAIIDLTNNVAAIQTENGLMQVQKYRDDKRVYTSTEGTNNIAIAYFPEESKSRLMSEELIESTFTELYFYKGENLDHFELFDHQIGVDGFDIYTWTIKW
jgi:dolichyl-phosphooligosaccharide-protein glycotransferase